MEFSDQQLRALEAVSTWLESDSQVFTLAGYAGTGKTTLARHVAADYYAAYTGKAAHVLRSKGCPNATTIHSLIYTPQRKSAERLKQLEHELELATKPGGCGLAEVATLQLAIKQERENLKRPGFVLNLLSPLLEARLVVIDECSMVDERMGEDLLSFGCKVLVLGDPAQLPPVRGGGYFTEGEPDFLLTEVHRQARGNPILGLATYVREEGRLDRAHPLVHRGYPTETMVMGVDQVIVGRNSTRRATNRRIREVLGHNRAFPEQGERVVCLRNNHQLGLLNGALYEVTDVVIDEELYLQLDGDLWVRAHKEPFVGEELSPWSWDEAELFDYGYVLTCHKAQGSQWDKVGVFDESWVFQGNARRWLYTAITRAAQELWVASL